MPLVYSNPNHAQEAQFVTEGGKPIVGFSSRIDGVNVPTYSMYMIGTSVEYQDNHLGIFSAYSTFLQAQVRVERRMVSEQIALRPVVEPEPESTV